MNQKPLSHDALLSQCFLYVWNTYPETRYTMFHVRNESRPVSESVLVRFLKFAKLFVAAEIIRAFIKSEYNSKERIIELSKGLAIGIVPGVLDLIWIWGRCYAFDIKIGADRLSPAQLAFQDAIHNQGGKCFEIRSFVEFKEIVSSIIDGKTQ